MTVMAAFQLAPLSCQDLGLQLAGKRVLHDIHLNLVAGETLAIVGPNGSGKSSLLKVLAGLRQRAVDGRATGRHASPACGPMPGTG